MERILPIDLENARLGRAVNGYRREEVDRLLRAAAHSLETALAENERLRSDSERLRLDNSHLRQQESLIKDALVAAQRASDDLRAQAQRQAELILEEARQAALAERVANQQAVSELRWEMERLRQQRRQFEGEFQALLERYQIELRQEAPQAVVAAVAE